MLFDQRDKLLSFASMPIAELHAAWLGLQAAVQQLHATNIWLEGGSTTVISQITKDFATPPAFHPLLRDLQYRKNTINSFHVSHTYREANQVADQLANKALLDDFVWSTVDEFNAVCLH